MIVDLVRCERDLVQTLVRLRERLDGELVAARADRVPHKELAYELQRAFGSGQTAAELERIARVLRQRTTVAHRRAAARAAGMCRVAGAAPDAHDRPRINSNTEDTTMERNYLRTRKIIEETYGPPGEAPDVEDLNDDLEDEDDDELDGADVADERLGGDEQPADLDGCEHE